MPPGEGSLCQHYLPRIQAQYMRLIGHSDQGGRPDGVQLMVHRGFAYIGHMVSQGFSVVDVRSDPAHHRQLYCRAAWLWRRASRRMTICCW